MKKIKILIGSYRRVKLGYLAKEVHAKTVTLESYLVKLIIAEEIHGKINGVDGYFENEDLTVNQK